MSNVWSTLTNFGTGASGYARSNAADWALLSLAINEPFTFACANRNAEAVAATPLRLLTLTKAGASKHLKGVRRLTKAQRSKLRTKVATGQSDDSEVVEVVEHPFLEMLNAPGQDLRGANILKMTQLYLEVFGRAYWLKVRSPVDGSLSIQLLPSYFVYPVRAADQTVAYYTYLSFIGDANGTTLQKEDVIDFRTPSISDLYAGGMSPCRAAYEKIALTSKWTEYQNTLLDNRARPDYIISPKADLSQEEAERIIQKFKDRLASSRNGSPLVLDNAVTLTPATFQPTDLAPLEISRETKKDICLVFGIPSALMDSDSATYSNYETALEDYARRAVLPRLCAFADVLNHVVLPEFGEGLFVEFDNPIPEDAEFKLKVDTLNVQRLAAANAAGVKISENERRELLGLEPTDDPADDDIEKPEPKPDPLAMMRPAAPQPPQTDGQQQQQQPQPEGGDQGAADEQASKAFAFLLKLNKRVAAGELPRAIAINLAAKFCAVSQDDARQLIQEKAKATVPAKCGDRCGCSKTAQTDRHAKNAASVGGLNAAGDEEPHKAIEAAVRKFFRHQRQEVLQHFSRAQSEGKSFGDKLADAIETKGSKLPDKFVPLDQWDKELAHEVKPLIEIVAKGQAKETLTRVGASDQVFTVVPAHVDQTIDRRAFNFARSTNATTTQNLNDALAELHKQLREGLIEGDGIDALTGRVNEIFDLAEDSRAERIARSEASYAVHAGQVIAAKASGVVTAMKYLVSSDACDLCQGYADQEVPLDDFDLSGAIEDTGLVPIHPNCTCSMTEVLSDDEGDDGEGSGEGEIE